MGSNKQPKLIFAMKTLIAQNPCHWLFFWWSICIKQNDTFLSNSCLRSKWTTVAFPYLLLSYQEPRPSRGKAHAVQRQSHIQSIILLKAEGVLNHPFQVTLTRLCWKWEPTPIPGEPGEGTGEELGEEWRFPVINMPISLSISSGNGRSTNMSSRGREKKDKNLKTIHPQLHQNIVFLTYDYYKHMLLT